MLHVIQNVGFELDYHKINSSVSLCFVIPGNVRRNQEHRRDLKLVYWWSFHSNTNFLGNCGSVHISMAMNCTVGLAEEGEN